MAFWVLHFSYSNLHVFILNELFWASLNYVRNLEFMLVCSQSKLENYADFHSMRIMIMKEFHFDLLIVPIFTDWTAFLFLFFFEAALSFGGPQNVKIFFFQHHWNHACFLICKRFAITAHPQLTVLRNLKMSDLIVRVS